MFLNNEKNNNENYFEKTNEIISMLPKATIKPLNYITNKESCIHKLSFVFGNNGKMWNRSSFENQHFQKKTQQSSPLSRTNKYYRCAPSFMFRPARHC